MSKTPRVADLINKHGFSVTRNGDKGVIVSDAKFAEEVFLLAKQLETELAEARAEIERKDKLIEQMREEIARLKRCCNCQYANHKLEICEHPDNEPETFMEGVCDLWSHNI